MSQVDLSHFHFERVLNEDARQRSIVLLGRYGARDAQPALLLCEKTQFDARKANALVGGLQQLSSLGANDVYHWLLANTQDNGEPDVKLTLISPCTDVHIKKHSPQTGALIRETPSMYETIVKPYIQSFPPERLQWVYNILEHKKEADTILFEDEDPDNGFIILPDLKWDQSLPRTMYLQTIVHTRSLKTVRDLTPQHLTLLRSVLQAARTVAAKFGVKADQVRCYVHYQPSYYHFHVHITHVDFEAHTTTRSIHISLDEIIDNLQLFPDYYSQRTLIYGLGSEHGLYRALTSTHQSPS